MKDSTLFFRSLAIIILIAGIAHLVRLGSTYTAADSNAAEDESLNEAMDSLAEKRTDENFLTSPIDDETDYIVGKWIVQYKSEEFNGAVLYDLKKEGALFNAYTEEYRDENGNSQKAEGDKVLTINEFDGYKGNGIYSISYEGKKYEVSCTIDMIDENTFKLSYDYYGYGDVETWKRR